MEDGPEINTYNFFKPGFADPPTDYYLRPYYLATRNETDLLGKCYQDAPAMKANYDYLEDFMRAMKSRRQKFFALHFMVELTHEYLNQAALIDPIVHQFLTNAFDQHLLDDTLLVFFSDHGIRFGLIRETMSGKYEERLPFMHIRTPKGWTADNLTVNEHRLTTPFDIHATLKHILNGEPDSQLKYGKSLLDEISVNRSCKSIPISDHWCGCHTSHVITDLKSVQHISEFIVSEANRALRRASAQCWPLSLESTQSAAEQRANDAFLQFAHCKNSGLCSTNVETRAKRFQYSPQLRQYLITVRVVPSNALLEATVNYDQSSHRMLILGEISRINAYSNQSHCLSDHYLKKLCFCRN